jgi:ATP-dependent DNA helicase RecG
VAAFDPRSLMEMAVEVMRCSVPEPRSDGKVSPLVGAVLWTPDRTVVTACRSELRTGDHAEYTILERKNRDCALDDARLFVTLEPCAPDCRSPSKLSCAERIVLARIKEVWVGIEDPDPTVDRKGIQYLQNNDVAVHMFDRDLQDVIREENALFMAQASERASAAEEEGQHKITLSPLERASVVAEMSDLSTDALNEYRAAAGTSDEVGSSGFARRLAQQGLLIEEHGRWTPSGFGVLLFGKEPRVLTPQAGVLATMCLPDGREETADFDGPQVLAVQQAMQWLRDRLPEPIDRSRARRRKANDPFYVLVREGLVNALVHRDYEIAGAKCQLVATSDSVTIKSPGGPPAPITLQQLQSFRAPMLSRNPIMHYVFAQMELAEERGLGMSSMRAVAESAELPLPEYSWDDPYLVLKVHATSEAALVSLGEDIRGALSKPERGGWEWLIKRRTATAAEYASAMGVPRRTALNHLSHFIELGLVARQGAARSTSYEVRIR